MTHTVKGAPGPDPKPSQTLGLQRGGVQYNAPETGKIEKAITSPSEGKGEEGRKQRGKGEKGGRMWGRDGEE